MTSDHDPPAAPTPANPPEEKSAVAGPASPEQSASLAATGEAGQRIRIGSQRWAEKNPAARPKPAGEFLPPIRPRGNAPREAAPGAESPAAAAPPAAEHASSPEPVEPAASISVPFHAPLPAEAATDQPPVAGQRAAASEPAGAAAPAAREPQRERGAGRPRGKQSRGERVPVLEPTAQRTVAPPNIRAELTPDLEQEMAEALGGLSVEEVLRNQSTPVEAELEPESRHQARVVMVHRDDVFVDLGGRQQGVLALHALPEPPEPGAVLDVVVARFNPAEGLYEVTLPGSAVRVEDWSQVSEGMIVSARVTGHNKGGLECQVNSLRGFIPASQASLYRVEDLSQFVDQTLDCVVTEANPDKRNLVLSHRALLERAKAEAKANLLAELEVGQLREGVVRSLQEFGAFVDLGGIDGLIHISQLSWDRIRHASEALELGQKVKVKVQRIDPATGKISLAFRDLAENPWTGAAQKYPPRSKVRGTVSRITEFGAFVRLESGIEGLIHISELSHKRVWRASDIVQEGQDVEVLVISVDAEHQRISLSLKALEARPTTAPKNQEEEPEPEPLRPVSNRKTPLKGGIGQSSGGEKFGLKW